MQNIAQIQTKIVQDLKQNFSAKLSTELTFHNVFCNYRTGAGLRVNKEVFNLMNKIYDTDHIKFQVKDNRVKSKHIVGLDKNLTMPWYVDYYKGVANNYDIITNNLYLFGQQDAFILKLHGGNLDQWLQAQT